jgi:hypothetical protein
MTLCVTLLLVWCQSSPVVAEPSHERVALFLSGQDCASQRRPIASALSTVSGVRHVDPDSVPDHVLVDVDGGAVAPEALKAAADRSLLDDRPCRIEIMQSCISASLPPTNR